MDLQALDVVIVQFLHFLKLVLAFLNLIRDLTPKTLEFLDIRVLLSELPPELQMKDHSFLNNRLEVHEFVLEIDDDIHIDCLSSL